MTPAATPLPPSRFHHVDMLRGLAALLVCIGHVRGLVWVDFGALQSPDAVHYALYFLTGLGHQAVVIFFALSGFLVGGAAFARIREGRFSARDYALRRLTRLWTVLIPALALTALWDWLGRDVLHARGYDGSYWGILSSGPDATGGITLSLSAFLGNAGFVQTLLVPTYGTNGPLWSLANEFWYYVAFPIGWYACAARARLWQRLVAALAFVVIMALLPQDMAWLGLIWLAGALAWPLATHWRWTARTTAGAAIAGGVAVLAGCVLVDRWPGLPADLILGGICALWLPVLANLATFGRQYTRIAKGLSELSYTLYVVHFPLLFLLATVLVLPVQRTPDAYGLALLVGGTLFAMLYAACIWRLFERNTDHIRRWVEQRLFRDGAAQEKR